MHSIFFLVCCLALFYSNPTKAENELPSILFSELYNFAPNDITPQPKSNVITNVEDETRSLPESYHPLIMPAKEEETEPHSILAYPTENISKSSSEEKEKDQEKTWAIWDKDAENSDSLDGSSLADANPTMPYARTSLASSQELTSTQINQALSTSFESVPYTDAYAYTNLSPSSLGVSASLSSVQSSEIMIPTASQALANSKSEPSATTTMISASEPSANITMISASEPSATTTMISASEPSANSTMISASEPSATTTMISASEPSATTTMISASKSSANITMISASEPPVITTTPTQIISGTAASSVPYTSLDTKPSNVTLPTTSFESVPIRESSSVLDSRPQITYSDSSSIILSTGTFSYSTSSNLNATQTMVYTSSSATLTSIGLQPLPINGSTSTQSSIISSSTAIYPSSTSSIFSPITSNGTATTAPSYSMITIPLLTTTLPQQSSSSSSSQNITYTQYPPSNFTSSSYNLPSSTQVSIKTTLSTVPSIIKPTATNTASTFIPSSIIAQTSSTHTSGQLTQTQATGIPSALPKIVQNPLSSSTPTQPVDTSEVQIGFEWALNYPFVVSHPLSTTQIFTYLPIGIADGLGLKPEQIVVKNLLPLDTTAELQFITTVARVFIPSSMVDTLRVDLGIAASPIYQNPDESVNTLMNYINPAIPFFPGAVLVMGASPTGSDTKNTQNIAPGDAGVFNSGTQQPQSPTAKGTTAGIAIAACGGAAAYGAAMFLLARRYKHRQQRQKRQKRPSSTDFSSEVGDEFPKAVSSGNFGDSSALMSGGRISPTAYDRQSGGSGRMGNNTRNAQISAPVMAENSLGWN